MRLVQGRFMAYYLYAVVIALASSMLTTVAGINICVLLLLLVSPWFWLDFEFEPRQKKNTVQFLCLIAAICLWDVLTNVATGVSLIKALVAMEHDLRTFGFIILLWPVFAVTWVARFTLWALVAAFVAVSAVNLAATLLGLVKPGQYLWPTMHHLHGQMSVGVIFLLAQLLLVRRNFSWRIVIPAMSLIVSMFVANERRAGYFLLVTALPLWVYLNRTRFSIKPYRWWLVGVGVVVIAGAASSPVVQSRVCLIYQEFSQYLALTPAQRAGVTTSVGIRLQFYTSIWELLKQSNWLTGLGSVNFGDAFSAVNYSMGTTTEQAKASFANFQNPHNEYLFMLSTKGVVGLVLYLAIFCQACRIALQKEEEVQRVGLLIFVFLFLTSITFNSMMIDMEEGHFTMLILLIFLAPKTLNLPKTAS
jgi:O-Antigen ligase